MTDPNYTAHNIKVLKGLEAVRKKDPPCTLAEQASAVCITSFTKSSITPSTKPCRGVCDRIEVVIQGQRLRKRGRQRQRHSR
jgi:DNA gyrase/topoisomerase IV subunit B